MTKIKGQYFRLKLGTKIVASSKSCTIHTSASLEDSSTKDSTGLAVEQECVSTSWDGSANGVVAVDSTDTNGLNGFDMLDLIGTTVTVEYYQSEGTKNREEVSGGVGYTGNAIVSDVSLDFPDRADSTYSIQFQGTGALQKKTA